MNGSASMNGDIITAGATLPRIADAQALDGRKVRVTWRSGEVKVVNLAPALESRRVYIPLRQDDALFQTLKVNEDGTAIEWSADLDFSAAWIDRLPADTFTNDDFREAMAKLSVSLDGMASALEISRRLVADYRKEKPIPRHIALATRYLVEHQAH